MFVDRHWVHVAGGRATAESVDEVSTFPRTNSAQTRLTPADVGLWQGAIRDRDDPYYREIADAISQREPITGELLYSDQIGAQRTITRFTLVPLDREDADEATRFISAGRNWYLDRAGPR